MPVVSSTNRGNAHIVRSEHRIKRRDISLSGDGHMRLWRNRWRHSLQKCAPPHFREHENIEEMHKAEHQHNYADLPTHRFEHLTNICGNDALLQCEGHITDVDKIKTHDEEVIDRIGQSFVAAERINQKNATVFVQRQRDPDGERNTQCDVNDVSPNYRSHGSFPSLLLVSMRRSFRFQKLQCPRNHLALL